MDIKLINKYGLLILVGIFFIINLYYKNLINILLFLVSYLILRNFIENETSIIIAYIISIVYGITKNFHLLENFKNFINNKNKDNFVDANLLKNMLTQPQTQTNFPKKLNNYDKIKNLNSPSRPSSPSSPSIPSRSSRPSRPSKDPELNNSIDDYNNKNKQAPPNIDSLISEELINEFINRVKKNDNLLITNTSINIYTLKPTLKKISKPKIESMKKKALTETADFIYKPIVISKDNFIIDGHHRWFVKKNLIESNTNSTNYKLYNEMVDVIIIDYTIEILIRKLQEFKIKFNKKLLSKSILDRNKLNRGRTLIKKIKSDLNKLDANYEELNKLKIL